MPFTPSHAVVALAVVRTPLVPAAVAIGAMTPDLPLFVRAVVPSYSATHSVAFLPATVLLALVLLLVWRCVLRPGVRELSPVRLAARLPEEWDRGAAAALRETFGSRDGRRRFSLTAVLVLLASLTLGVLTHIGWDLFTHEGRWGAEAFPVLADRWGPVPGYTWLQHASSVLGLTILAAWGARRLSARDPRAVSRMLPDTARIIWWTSLPVVLATAWGVGLLTYGPMTGEWTVAHLAYRVLPPACALWGAMTLCLAVAIAMIRGNTGRKAPSTAS